MNDNAREEHISRFSKHRFVAMIVFAILVSFVLVGVALGLYASSGAAQIDLSRPGYSSVRDKITEEDDNSVTFPTNGPITKDVLKEFETQYDEIAKNITGVDAFDPQVLSDSSLQITNTN